MLIDSGFFGRMLSVRGEFGYWVFEGDLQPASARRGTTAAEDGGGIILDMLCHWRYVLDNLFGEVKSVSCLGATHIPQRWDEPASPTPPTADDAAYATFELEGRRAVIAQINMSWTTRVRRDDLVTFHVDGTHGSAVAGPARLPHPARVNTPKPVWNPDQPQTMNFFDQLAGSARQQAFDNGFKTQWEMFIRHVAEDAPYRGTCWKAPRACSWSSCALQSWKERRWVDVPALKIASDPSHATMHDCACPPPPARWSPTRTRPEAFPARGERPFNRVAFSAAHVVADPRADIDPWLTARSTGTPPSPTASTCGRWAWAWPRRWTPRSAAWGWTGRPRWS
jgi:hypothetical protein